MTWQPILDAIDEPAFVVAEAGEVLAANSVAVEVTGRDTLVGQLLDTLVQVPHAGDSGATALPDVLRDVGRCGAELVTVDGGRQAVDVAFSPLAVDPPAGLVVAAVPVSRHEQRGRALRRLKEAEGLAGLGSWEWDVTTGAVYWSEQMFRLLGYEPGEIEPDAERYIEMVHPEDRDHVRTVAQSTFEGDQSTGVEHRLVRADGKIRHVRSRYIVARDDDRQPLRLVGCTLDVTEHYELQRRKDEFVSMVSHELRTPLASISGALGLLVSGTLGELPARVQRMIEIASSNCDRLVRLINDILDLERIESGVEMVREEIDAEQLVSDVLALMGPAAQEADVQLEAAVDEPGRLVGDADRLQQVLTNLVSNAIKFSPEGATVTTAARREDDEVVFSVTDRGRGIPPDFVTRIFERFEQVDSSDARQKGGTGLGLSICRSIVDEHGGQIWVDSELGHGATVIIRLPAGPVVTESGPAGGPLVLVCDDEPDARAIAQATLEAGGYRVVTARNGDDALRRALDERPDAIVLDLIMPGRDGWQTVAALRRDPTTSDIPIVIFSVLPYEDAAAPSGHVTDWVDKAMVEADLVTAVDQAVGSVDEQSTLARLLLVEDDPGLASVLAEAFRRHEVAVWVARDGNEAERLCASVRPHVLVLDLMLPDRNGFSVVESLRQQDQFRRTPLVVYTALDLDAEQRAELRLGPTLYYTKGRVSPQELEDRVLELLRGVVPRTPTSRATATE